MGARSNRCASRAEAHLVCATARIQDSRAALTTLPSPMALALKLAQSSPGSWTHIDILVEGVKRFHAAKAGTDFCVIVDEHDKTTIGCGTGRAGVRATVKAHLATHGIPHSTS